MSSGTGEASGAGGIDLNCDTVAILYNHEIGVDDGLEDAPVSTGGELLDRESGDTMVVGGDEKKECEIGIADREDGMMGNGEGSAGSELGGGSEFGVVGTVKREAGAESHGGKPLEVEFEENRSTELVSASTVGFEDVEASSQTSNLGDGSGGDQKRGADVDMEGVMGTDEVSLTALVGGGGTEDERLEGSSNLRREQVKVQLVDGGGEPVGQLDLEEREPEGESITVNLMEVNTREKEITDILTVSSEKFEAVDASNQAVSLGNVSGDDQIQEVAVDVEGPRERGAEVTSHSGKFLQVEKEEDGSPELAVVSTEEFEHVEISIHAVEFHDGSGGDQKRGTDLDAELDLGEKESAELVAVSTVGFEAAEAGGQAMYLGDGSDDDQNRVTDASKEDMVGTDEDSHAVLVCGGGAEDERLEGSSNLREEQVEVELVDGSVQVEAVQLGPEAREAEGESLHIKLLEMDKGRRDDTDPVVISAEDFEAVKASNQAVDLGDDSGSDQKQGIDLDSEGMVIDGQLGTGEREAEVKSYSRKFLKVDKGGEGSAVLVSVSTEEFQPVEASRLPMDFHDGSGDTQKRVTDLDAEGMVIDGELGSGKREAEVNILGGKLFEVDRGENGSTVLVSVSTERFELANVCTQSMDLGDESGDDQRLGTIFDAESMVRIDEDSVAISIGSFRKLLEVDYREKRSAELLAVSTENSEPVKASSQAINLLHRSGDGQRLVTNVDADGMVEINEDPVTISVPCGGTENERSEVSLVFRKEKVEVQVDLGDGRGQAVDGELDTSNREAEFKSYSRRFMKVNMGEKGSAKLASPSAELFVEASSEAMNLGDGSDGGQNRDVDVDAEGLMRTDEVSLTVLIVGGGVGNEKMEGSSFLRREKFEIQVDESDQAVGPQLGCGEREAEVHSHEGMPLDLHTGEKESTNLVAASAEEFEAIEPSNQAMNSGNVSGADQIQGIDADAEGVNLDVQLGPGGRDTEVSSHSRKLLEVDKREKESAEPVAVSTEIFVPVETSSQATDFGDESDADQMRGADGNEEHVAIDTELSLGKSLAGVESKGEKFLEVDRDDEGSAELPAVSTERFLPFKSYSEHMNLVNGYGGDQRLETDETDVDAEAMVITHEDSVAISIASGAPEGARLEGSLILRKEHVEVQCNLVDGFDEVVEGELGTAISVAVVKSCGERCMEVDMGEKGSTKLVATSTVRAESVEACSQSMDLGDGSGSDQIQETGADAEDLVQNEDSVTVLVVGGVPGNEGLEESLTSGKEQVEVLVHLVDECGQVENELVSHGGKLLEVELGEKRKELIAASAESFDAFEVSCQAMDSGDLSGSEQTQGIDVNADDMVDISDDSAADSGGGGGREDERLEEDSSVLGIEQVEALQKPVDGCGQIVDGKFIHRERTPIVESHGGMLLKVETGVEGGDELYTISAEGFEAVEACSQATDLEHGYCGDQKQGSDVDAEYAVGTSGDSVNISCADAEPDNESLERSLLLGKEHIEVLQDLMDGHDQVLDDEFGPGKREAELVPHSAKLLELVVREKCSAELASVPAGASGAVDASSQAMDVEDRYSSELKQEIIIGSACMVRTDEDSVVVSVDGGGPEDEMLNGSSNLVKEAEVGEETHGTGSTMEYLPESTKNESAGYDIMIHAAQVQTEFDGVQRHGIDVGEEIMVGTEQATLAVSVGGGGPEDERLDASFKFGEKQVDVKEDNTWPGTPEKKLAHIQKIEGAGVDAMRDTGHAKDPVHGNHVEDLDLREGFGGDHGTESCVESDAEPLVVTVTNQGAEAQGLEVAPRSDGEQVKVRCGDDGSQMVEKAAHFQNSGDSVDVHVCDLVEGHPDEMEGEIVGDNGEVNSEFSAREENIIEIGLVSLPESVEAVHDFMDHAMDDRDPGSDGHGQETVVTYMKHDIGFESFQGSGLELMGVETGIVQSIVGSERVEVLPQASSVENDPKVYDENNNVAGETVQKLDSIPIPEERDTGLQQVNGDMQSTVVSGSAVTCLDVEKTALALDAAVNVEAWSSNEHTSVDNMVEKGNVLLEDNGSVMNVTSAELQNGDAQQNFDYQNQKIDSSPLMVPCREEEAGVAGCHSTANFFMEKGYSIMEDPNSLVGISISESSAELVTLTFTPQWNESSVGCQDVRPPNIPSRDHKELELEQGTPALESVLHAVDETIDSSQKLQDGTPENLKEFENQSEGYDGTSTESASISRQSNYYLSFPEKEGFSTSDLVWGKVKSHPWWPGQIFDFSGASQLAIKYQKKDHFLVAYFGDKTFAWCEESRLKPFHSDFSQMEKQTSSDSFLRALCDILLEISRRVVLSMTCLCLSEETYADIKYQKVENAGVHGKIVNSVFDRCEIVNYFHPDQLLEYVRELAQIPTGGADRLELTIAQAQLKAFYLSKGYTELPAFTNGSGLVENDFETPSSTCQKLNDGDLEHSATLSDLFSTKGKLRSRDGTLVKQKQVVEDGRKQKSLSELMEEETTFLLVNKHENASEMQDGGNSLSSANKRKALDYVSTDIGRSKTKKIDFQADEETKLSSPTSNNSSFKVGAFISRAASKLTSGQPIRKCLGETSERGLFKTDDWSVDYMDLDDFLDVPFDRPKLQIEISGDYPPTNEMLSKLYLAARNPLKGYNLSSIVINFLCTFRNVQVSNISIENNTTEKPRAKRGRKKKIILDLESPDMSTPDHMKDSYWSDMIIPEKDASLNSPKRRGRKKRKFVDESSPYLVLSSPSECEPKLHTGTVCPHVKHILTAERPIISVEEKIVDERTPTAVILYFNNSNSLPSDMDLIRIFSRYGPLKEEETYIERKNNSAMVVFKKRTDAEMAFSSAGKFSTFGPALLSYRLRHFPLKSSPVDTLIGEDDATPIKDGHLGILVEPEISDALDGKLCEAVNKESSIFVQSRGHFEPVLDMPPGAGEFPELARYQVGDVVVSDSAVANTGRKEPLQDVPAQMETGAVSDHLLLESLDQEFSYFDLDQAEAGDISGTDVGGEKSSGLLLETLEVSHAANDRSLDEELCDPVTDAASPKQVAVTGTSNSLAKQLENGTVLEIVDQEFSGSALPAELKDIINEFNIAPDQPEEKKCSNSLPVPDRNSVTIDVQLMEADSIAEQREVTTASDSTQIELERRDPSVSVTNVEAAGMPSLCISEQKII